MANGILEFSGFQARATDLPEDPNLYIQIARIERWDEDGQNCDLVFIDRGSEAHTEYSNGSLTLEESDTVEVVDMHQEWVEFTFEPDDDDDDTMVTIGGAFGIEEAKAELEPLIEADLYLTVVCRPDGDSPAGPQTFETECSGTVDSIDLKWTP